MEDVAATVEAVVEDVVEETEDGRRAAADPLALAARPSLRARRWAHSLLHRFLLVHSTDSHSLTTPGHLLICSPTSLDHSCIHTPPPLDLLPQNRRHGPMFGAHISTCRTPLTS